MTEILSAAIRTVRARLLDAGRYPDLPSINAGGCTAFTRAVRRELGREFCDEIGLEELGIDNLMESEDDEPTVMDRALLAEHWPLVVPPEGLGWDDIDALAAAAGFSCGTHEWLVLDGRHYDAEAPDGVDNPFDLPFFQRVVAGWLEERDAAPRP